jgi:branched-chain amino acid transport system substrate-binding protein
MRAAQPDWVFVTGYVNDLILVRKQMKDLGVSAQVVTMIAGPAYKEFLEATGPLAENVSSAAWWHPAVRYNGKGVFGSTEDFDKLWAAKYSGEPDYGQASAAAAGEILQLAIEAAGATDPAKVRDALATMNTETFFGRIKFGPNGQITSLDPPVFQLQGRKPIVIFPEYIKQGEFRFGVQ